MQVMDIHNMKIALGLDENHGASSKLQKGSCIENLPGRLSAGPLPMKDATEKCSHPLDQEPGSFSPKLHPDGNERPFFSRYPLKKELLS